jgi:hypothetical protein
VHARRTVGRIELGHGHAACGCTFGLGPADPVGMARGASLSLNPLVETPSPSVWIPACIRTANLIDVECARLLGLPLGVLPALGRGRTFDGLGPVKLLPCHFGVAQVDPAQVSVAQVRIVQFSPGQAGVAQAGMA